jgi:peptide deformylase
MTHAPESTPFAPHGPLPEGGTVREITRWGQPVMHRKLRPVTAYDASLRDLVADMVATMYAADGVGLAANQIGEDLAVFVFDCPDESGRHTVGIVCNPVVTLPLGKERRLDDGDEGCLSYPGAFVPCPRPDWAAVDGTGLDGQPVHFQGDGMLARCLQHEADHLDGTVFGDRVSLRARKRLQKLMERDAEDYPKGWPVG